MPFEHYSQPILAKRKWYRRVLGSIWIALTVVLASLMIGILGYHVLGGLGWIDSLLEASMILGGMGPVATMSNDAVKIFASLYALFSGLMLLSIMGILMAPWLHRMMHHFFNDHHKHSGSNRK